MIATVLKERLIISVQFFIKRKFSVEILLEISGCRNFQKGRVDTYKRIVTYVGCLWNFLIVGWRECSAMDLDDLGSTKVGSDMDVVVMKDYTIGMKFKTNDWVIVCIVLEL